MELPPLIKYWIAGLNDPKESVWQRDNYRNQLESLRDTIAAELEKHDGEILSARHVKGTKHR